MRVGSYMSLSPIHGVGCFSSTPISKGELVWEFDHGIDRELSFEEVQSLPGPVLNFLQSHAWKSPKGTILICSDHGGYFNHADDPNTTMSEDGYRCYATRDIQRDEELTTNYSELPDYQEAATGPELPRFRVIEDDRIVLSGVGPKGPWNIPISGTDPGGLAEQLNVLIQSKVLRVEKVTL